VTSPTDWPSRAPRERHEPGSAVSRLRDELEELRQRERRFRAISDYTYDWESWHDTAGRLVWVNRAVERLTGCSPAACLCLLDYPLSLIAPEDRDRIVEVLANAQAGGSGNDVEFRMVGTKGELRWGAISWQTIYDDDGISMGFRTSVRDISERKRMEEQIRQNSDDLERLVAIRTAEIRRLDVRRTELEKLAALGKLAAGVAHEINNPLAGIRNAFALIRSELPATHPYHSYLALIDSEIDRIGGIVRQMYRLYRPRSQTCGEFELTACVRGVSQLIELMAKKRRIEIRIKGGTEPILVHLPEGELRQILYNVMLNSIEASSSGGEVVVEVLAESERIEIRVTDQGHGIPPEILPRIFEPFFTTKTDGEGSLGLGLPVSYGLARAMGGSIAASSNAHGGTTLTVTLPKRAPADA
jgi:PAS domain S-box-containing protein